MACRRTGRWDAADQGSGGSLETRSVRRPGPALFPAIRLCAMGLDPRPASSVLRGSLACLLPIFDIISPFQPKVTDTICPSDASSMPYLLFVLVVLLVNLAAVLPR